jgi:hypothetical protein
MAKAKKKVSGDAAGTPSPASAQSAPAPAAAPQRDGSRQARRELDDDLRAAQAKEVEDALRRAKAWQRAIVTLEGLLADPDWIQGTRRTEPLHDINRTLNDAANRLPSHRQHLLAMTFRIGCERPRFDTRFEVADDLGQSLKALRVLLEEDLAIAQPEPCEPQDPLTPEESGYLKLLRDLDDGDTLSDEIAAKRIGYADPGSIVDLRKALREKGWKAIASKKGRGGGSSLDRSLLTPAQRDRLDAL